MTHKHETLDAVKTHCLAHFKDDRFLTDLVVKFGGEVVDTGGHISCWLLCYDGKHTVSVGEECLCVCKAKDADEWFENNGEIIEEETVDFYLTLDDLNNAPADPKNEAVLIELIETFCAENNLEHLSADEMLHEELSKDAPNEEVTAWLNKFIAAWNKHMEGCTA